MSKDIESLKIVGGINATSDVGACLGLHKPSGMSNATASGNDTKKETSASTAGELIPLYRCFGLAGIPFSRATVGKMARTGSIRCVRIGSRWFGRVDDIKADLVREITPVAKVEAAP